MATHKSLPHFVSQFVLGCVCIALPLQAKQTRTNHAHANQALPTRKGAPTKEIGSWYVTSTLSAHFLAPALFYKRNALATRVPESANTQTHSKLTNHQPGGSISLGFGYQECTASIGLHYSYLFDKSELFFKQPDINEVPTHYIDNIRSKSNGAHALDIHWGKIFRNSTYFLITGAKFRKLKVKTFSNLSRGTTESRVLDKKHQLTGATFGVGIETPIYDVMILRSCLKYTGYKLFKHKNLPRVEYKFTPREVDFSIGLGFKI